MAEKIDTQVKEIADVSYKNAQDILKKLRSKLDTLAEELIKRETIEAEDFVKIIGPKVNLAKVKA